MPSLSFTGVNLWDLSWFFRPSLSWMDCFGSESKGMGDWCILVLSLGGVWGPISRLFSSSIVLAMASAFSLVTSTSFSRISSRMFLASLLGYSGLGAGTLSCPSLESW